MNITTPEGRTFTGTPKQIIQQMHDVGPFSAALSLDEYVDRCVVNAETMGQAIAITGANIDERAASLLSELLRVGFVASE